MLVVLCGYYITNNVKIQEKPENTSKNDQKLYEKVLNIIKNSKFTICSQKTAKPTCNLLKYML